MLNIYWKKLNVKRLVSCKYYVYYNTMARDFTLLRKIFVHLLCDHDSRKQKVKVIDLQGIYSSTDFDFKGRIFFNHHH